MTMATVASVATTAVAAKNLFGGGGSGGSAAAAADPFAGQRGQYQTMLQHLMTGQPLISSSSMVPPAQNINQNYSPSGIIGGRGHISRPRWQNTAPDRTGTQGMTSTGQPTGITQAPGVSNDIFQYMSSDPSAMFRYTTGLDSLNRSLAGSGLLDSGNRLQALEGYGQNFASTEFQNEYSRLAQLSGATIGSPATAGQIIQGNQQGQAAALTQGLQGLAGIFGGSGSTGSGSLGGAYFGSPSDQSWGNLSSGPNS
jgi:hypothetical protein